MYIILWTPTVTRSNHKATQTDNTIQIEDINKILKCISDNINNLHQEYLQFSVKQGMTYSLTDTLATSVSSSFENIDHAWQQQVHLSQVASDCINTKLSKAQWTQFSLTKELATQQTFWELQNSLRPKIQNK